MRGWWKPVATYGALVFGVTAALVLTRGGGGWLFLVVPLGVSPIVLVQILRSTLPVSRFVRGLREGGVTLDVAEDAVGWFGDRRLVAREARGEWRVECWAGSAIHLQVRGPVMRAKRDVRGNARSAGRAAAPLGALT